MKPEQRLILAFVFALLIAVAFQKYVVPPKKEANTKSKPAPAQQAANMPKANPTSPFAMERSRTPAMAAKMSKGKVITLELPYATVRVNSFGGVLNGYALKKYRDAKGKPMELIEKQGYFQVVLPDNPSLAAKVNTSTFTMRKVSEKGKTGVELTLTLPAEKLTVKKRFLFSLNAPYTMEGTIEASQGGKPLATGILMGPQIAPTDRKSHYAFAGPLVYLKDKNKAKEVKLKKDGQHREFTNPYWVALQSLYFTSTVVPSLPTYTWIERVKKDHWRIAVWSENPKPFSFWGFVGPKRFDLLKSFNMHLEENIRFGMFAIIAKPALEFLNYLYGKVHNYGWAIIILTLILKILFHPLTAYGYKSMAKMQDLQPKLQEIKRLYKDDPAKMNEETMALYKREKINPMGGCLPMLLQIPVFFALYKVLMVAIELRHAPFIGYLTDLSAKDPYYITPVLMGATMFLQQKMTPAMGDSTQNKIMLAMPIVFTFLFLNFPSGLVLYWLVNNVISIGEQYLVKKVYAKKS